MPHGRKAGDLKAGDVAPAFALADADGTMHRLQDYKGRWVVLYFYPKDSTPGCTREACEFRDALPGLKRRRVTVLGVSPDSARSHGRFRDRFELNFPLLVDEDHAVAERYGVWQEKKLYGKTFMGIVRSTFVIDPEGWLYRVYRRVKVDGHVDEITEALRQR